MTPDLDALLALADAATPGEWREYENCIRDNSLGLIGSTSNAFKAWKENAAFIAAANPETVKALIERIRSLETQIIDTHAAYEEHLALAVANLKRAEQAEAGAAQLREVLTKIAEYQGGAPRVDARKALASTPTGSRVLERLKAIDTLYDAIAHGDDEHRRWLKEKLAAHFGASEADRD